MENKISIKEKYKVIRIETNLTKEWVLKKHYAKRKPPIEFAIGLFDNNNMLVGITTYARPVSDPLRNLWDNKYKVYELNRLVINENLEKNVLSYFVSKSFVYLPQPSVIVSYADTSQNHNGYIYQATNWIYTGLSAEHKDFQIVGLEHLHGASIFDKSKGQKNRADWLRQKYGDKIKQIDRARKHRYFYFLGTKTQKKDMLKMLPYVIEKYPKGENKRYDASYEPLLQNSLF